MILFFVGFRKPFVRQLAAGSSVGCAVKRPGTFGTTTTTLAITTSPVTSPTSVAIIAGEAGVHPDRR